MKTIARHIQLLKTIMAMLAMVLFVCFNAQAQYHANCWLAEKSGYPINFYGSNPSVADFQGEIRALAVHYKVPVEIIGAVCQQESVGGFQYDADGYRGPGHVGTGFVVHNVGECQYCFTHGVINQYGAKPPPGLGLMQLTGDTATGTGDIGRLITDWRFNLEAGVKVLVDKYNVALTTGDDPTWMEQLERENMHVLENWFYGLRYYNGYKSQAQHPSDYLFYLNLIYGKIASASGRLNGLFSPVTITKPASVIEGWVDGTSFVALPTGEWKDKDNKSFNASVHVSGGGTTGAKAVLTAPAPGTRLTGASVTFTRSTGSGVAEAFIYAGNSAGANDIYGGSMGTGLSVTIGGLPVDGRTIFIRLWSSIAGAWVFNDYSYAAKR